MKQWYASVSYGLEKIACDIVKECGAKNIQALDSALTFSYVSEINIKAINNLFVIFSRFHSKDIIDAAKKISRLAFHPPRHNGKTFRVVIMDCGKLRAIPQNIMAEAERNISRRTGFDVHRANPDIEIWVNRRNDGLTFFMMRVKKHPPFDKSLKQGELRPDIADIMLRKAALGKHSVIVDMFGGWGAIAAAVCDGWYRKILTGDINDECVNYQKSRLENKPNCIVQKWDARRLPIESRSVDSVVTDPPWGEYEQIGVSELYDDFINEAARILRPGGSFVFITSAINQASQAMQKHGFIYTTTPFKLSGKETFLVCAKKAP